MNLIEGNREDDVHVMKALARLIAFICCSMAMVAQNVPLPPAITTLSAYDTRGSGLPANSPSTLLNFTLESDTTGENSFHVVTSDPGVIVSLILPSGTEITSSNAASLGFTYTVLPDNTGSDVESILSLPGTHVLIQVPGGQASGTYSIKANASGVNTDSGIIASYFSSSNVRTALTTNSSSYKVGDTVVLSELVFDAATPVASAAVTAGVSTPTSLTAQTSVGSPQLVSQQSVGPNLTEYEYSFTLTNSGPAIQEVQAVAVTVPQNVSVVNDVLLFGSVAANGTATSITRLIVQHDPASNFDPSALQWNVTATGPVSNVTLTDSGPFDAATGDGIYTGTFVPTSPGTYTVVSSATGISSSGNSFSRTAIGSFEVTAQELASFGSFSDSQQSDGITVEASVNVQTAGTYRFTINLQANNQKSIQAASILTLAPGSQQLAVKFSNSQLFSLAVNGPYERVNALLVYAGNSVELIADSRSDAGQTAAYMLGSFAPSLYYTGQNSAIGVITGAGPTFDLLRATIGVFNSVARSCSWTGILTDAAGTSITEAGGSAHLPAGTTSVTLDFNGNSIARAGPGPYIVKQVGLLCPPDNVIAHTLFSISGFTASQFTFVSADFSLSLTGPAPAGTAGVPIAVPLQLSSVGDFQGDVEFSVSGLPTGAAGSFTVPGIVSSGPTSLVITTPASLAPGNYSFNVGYASGGVAKTLPLTVAIAAPQAEQPTFSPTPGTYSSTKTVTISSPTPGASIRYTIDGSDPTATAGIVYSSPINVNTTTTIKAVAYKSGLVDSAIATATYTIILIAAAPTFSPTPGTYTSAQVVTIGTTTPGAAIRYTTDGTAPSSTAGTLYTGPITVSASITIYAVAYESGWITSVIASATYAINPPVATPTFSPTAGTYSSTQSVTISTTTSGASIRYTTDGSTPTSTVGTLYSTSITVSSTVTIKALAYKSGVTDSAVASATYTIGGSGNGYGYHRTITIDHSKVPNTDQSNFPFLFDTTDALLKTTGNGGHVSSSSGYDIIFTSDAAGTVKLDHEIESYDASTGQLVAWVRIPAVSHTTDTVIYLFYGNSGITTSQENKTGVWDANFKGVWHLPNGSTLSANDSTTNADNGTPQNSPAAVGGQIGGAAGFVRSNQQYINLGNNSSLWNGLTSMTWSAWIYPTENPGTTTTSVLSRGTDSGWRIAVGSPDHSGAIECWLRGSSGTVKIGTESTVSNYVNSILNTWNYITCAYDGSTFSMYVNGALVTSTSATAGPYGGGAGDYDHDVYIGNHFADGYFSGRIDEARVSGIARSEDWITTEYHNQGSPSTFYVLSNEPGAGSPASILATAGTPQSSRVDTAFGTALQATVKDSNNNPVSGATVTFTAPGSGASGTFGGSATATVTTNSSGIATSPTLTATATAGSYTVTASVSGVATPANFSLTNNAASSGYAYHRTITIDHSKVPNTDQGNFPFLFNTTDALLKTTGNGGHVSSSGGYDIIFTSDAAGTVKLDHEIESYDASTGQLIAWVRIPTLSHTTDTVIYLFYGNSGTTTSQENKTGVWDANFKGVWHLGNSATLLTDSTASAANLTNNGMAATGGFISGGASFDGDSAWARSAATTGTSGDVTISAWVSMPSFRSDNQFAVVRTGDSGTGICWYSASIGTAVDVPLNWAVDNGFSEDLVVYGSGSLSVNTWYLLTSTTKSNDSINIYVNGNLVGTRTVGPLLDTSVVGGPYFAFGVNSCDSDFYSGKLDEVQVSNSIRSADWIKSEYNSQSAPSTFYALGGEVGGA